MGATALPGTATHSRPQVEMIDPQPEEFDWTNIALGSAFLAGSVLLLSGRKRAGLVVTAAATALTMVDQRETVREWWNALPKYLDDAQDLLNKAQTTIDDLSTKREKLRALFKDRDRGTKGTRVQESF